MPPAHPLPPNPTSLLLNLLQAARPVCKWALPWTLALTVAALGPALPASAKAPTSASTTLPSCSWDSPGTNPYLGELAAAVDHYTDIPASTRVALKSRIAQRHYDDIAVIGRDHITGGQRYSPEIRDMHFGNGRLCRKVTRQRWAAQAEERGLVYCEGAHCIIVPTVCRNVSRIQRQQVLSMRGVNAPDRAADEAGGGASASQLTALLPEHAELQFEAPGAGPTPGNGAQGLTWTGPEAMTLIGPDTAAAHAAPHAATSGSRADAAYVPPVVALPQPGPVALDGRGSFGDSLPTGPAQPISPLLPVAGAGGGLIPVHAAALAAPVPEPGTAVLMVLGLAVVARRAAAHHKAAHPPPRPSR